MKTLLPISLLFCVALAAGAEGDKPAPAPAPAPADGTWSGTGDGYKGPVEVSVTVKEGRMTEVKVVQQEESRPRTALKEIPKRIVEKQSTEVDAVTGATMTSTAIMDGAAAALEKAREAAKPPAAEEAPKDPQGIQPPAPEPVKPAEPLPKQ